MPPTVPYTDQQHPPQPQPAAPVAYSIRGAAAASGFGVTTIYEAIRQGELLSVKYRKRRVILRDDLLTWLARYRV